MDDARFQRLSELFEGATARAPEARGAFLDEQCGGDAALRAELEGLLGHAEKPDDPVVTAAGLDALFEEAGLRPRGGSGSRIPEIVGRQSNHPTPHPLHHPTAATMAGNEEHATNVAPMPLLTGQYKIVRVVGEGGMGIVYEAEQAFPKRRVALKSIRPGLFSRRMLRRFQNEAHILGRLQHPGIAQIYEAGASDPESPDDAFFVMEFVDGPPLTTYAEEKKLTTAQRAELMIQVCDAVHHAHQRGVIHRDLKPGNILIAEDASGAARPKVLDFGVARVTDARTTGGDPARPETMLTHAGQLIGTLAYMSPEQISAGPDDVDVRTDVYALGVVLYQLLTGRLPLDLADKSIPDAVQMVREAEPSRLGTIDRAYRGDLETIVAKALEKDRTRRYQSAAELGEDLRRYLAGEAIAAKRDSAMYVLRKQVKRHKGPVALAATVLVGLIAFGILATVQARHNRLLADTLADQLVVANTDRGRLEVVSGAPYIGEKTLWIERLQRPDISETYWALWEHYSRQPVLATTPGVGMYRSCILLTPDHRLVIWTGRDGEVQAWTPDLQRCVWRLAPDGISCANAAVSADGAFVAMVGAKGKIVLLDPKTGEVIRRFSDADGEYRSVAISPDGTMLYTGDIRGAAQEWRVADGVVQRTLTRGLRAINHLAISPDGTVLMAGTAAGTCAVIDLDEGKMAGNLKVKTALVRGIRFSRDGAAFYMLMDDRLLHIFNTRTMTESDTFDVGDAGTFALLDDRTIATSGRTGMRFWDLPTKSKTGEYPGEEGGRAEIIAGPRPGTLLMCEMGSTLRLWETPVQSCATRLLGGTGASMYCVAPSSDGKLIAGADAAGIVRVWDVATRRLLGQCDGPSPRGRGLSWLPGTREFVAVFSGGEVGVFGFDEKGVRLVSTWKAHNGDGTAAALSPDGALLATGSQKDGIKVWDMRTHALVRSMATTQGNLSGLDFSPDGTRLASAGIGPGVAVSNVATGALLSALPDSFQNYRLRYSPDGKHIAVAHSSNEIRILDAATLTTERSLRGHATAVIDVHFSEDGKLLVTGSHVGTVRLWNIASGRSLVTLDMGGEVFTAMFLPGSDNGRVVMSGEKGQVRLIDLHYYDQHIARNTGYFLNRLGSGLPNPARTEELLAWARKVTGNPEMTFDDPVKGMPLLPNGLDVRAAPTPIGPTDDQ